MSYFCINVICLTGNCSQLEKKRFKKSIENGECDIIIGTHAIIEESIVFSIYIDSLIAYEIHFLRKTG